MILSKKSKNKEKRRYWEDHIKEWRRSGLTQNEYCRHNHLDPSTSDSLTSTLIFSDFTKNILDRFHLRTGQN